MAPAVSRAYKRPPTVKEGNYPLTIRRWVQLKALAERFCDVDPRLAVVGKAAMDLPAI